LGATEITGLPRGRGELSLTGNAGGVSLPWRVGRGQFAAPLPAYATAAPPGDGRLVLGRECEA